MDYKKFYFLEDYLFGEVKNNFHKNGYLTPEEFFAIIIWKSNRSKTKIRQSIKKSGKTIKEITNKIFKTKTPKEKIETLTKIKFIGIPIASAILTVCFPNDFTILDYRVWDLLKKEGVVKGARPSTAERYVEYIDICKKYAKDLKVSLRDFDRIMWGKSFYNDLLKFLK